MFRMPVFSATEARAERGGEAKEMLTCPVCDKIAGVLVCQTQRMDYCGENTSGDLFDVLIWERWRCLNCGNIWIERYGIRGKRSRG